MISIITVSEELSSMEIIEKGERKRLHNSVSEELSSMEMLILLIYSVLQLFVSEELSSMEILISKVLRRQLKGWFQKNLVVWK